MAADLLPSKKLWTEDVSGIIFDPEEGGADAVKAEREWTEQSLGKSLGVVQTGQVHRVSDAIGIRQAVLSLQISCSTTWAGFTRPLNSSIASNSLGAAMINQLEFRLGL